MTTPTATQLDGTLTLTFQPNAAGVPSGYRDPATQFAAGGTTINFTIPAGASVATLPQSGALQLGTVAGTITVTLTRLVAGGTDVLPQPPPSQTVEVARLAPAILAGSVMITNLTSAGFNVELDAYSTPRDLSAATFNFRSANGTTLNGMTSFNVSLDAEAPDWFTGTDGLNNGSRFHLTVPFTFSGDLSVISGGSVTVTLSNSVGISSQETGSSR